jgi:GNAT superfamily N-acetyltransferase
MEIQFAQSEQEILDCWEVVKELRPHLTDQQGFLQQVKEMMQDGYRMIYVVVKGSNGDKAVAFAGFRNMQMLFTGKMIYIDDLCTLPAFRGKGYASQLLDYVHQLAKDTGKTAVHLDSGYQRKAAHRLYLQKGFELSSHHFVQKI